MLRKRIVHALLGVVFVIGLNGCSDDSPSGPGGGGNGDEAPSLTVSNVGVPAAMSQSNNPMAVLATSYVSMANSFTGWLGFFRPPAGAAKMVVSSGAEGGPWVHTWTDGSLSVVLTITELADRYTWSVVVDGTDGDDTFDNFLMAHAEAFKNSERGSMVVYDLESTLAAITWNWEINASDVYNFLMFGYESGSTQDGFEIDLTVNPNQSGDLSFSEVANSISALNFRSTWQSTGAGEWWRYEGGEVSETGTWQ